jgi:HK97 family phage major capsid protein
VGLQVRRLLVWQVQKKSTVERHNFDGQPRLAKVCESFTTPTHIPEDNMNKLRLAQDEISALIPQIENLRNVDPVDDKDGAAAAALERALTRADELNVVVERENAIEARLSAARSKLSNVSDSEPRAAVEKGEVTGERADIRSGVQAFSSAKAASLVGGYLRQLFTGEIRAMGETSSTYDAKGAEYVIGELYNAIVNRLQYASVGLQLATVIRPSGAKISFPKVGDATAAFVGEGTATSDQDLSTSVSDLTLYEMRASVAVSRSLLEDSPIDVAGLVAERFALSYAQKFDAVWLGGNSASPSITGLAASVAGGNTITVAAGATATTLNNLADVVGKVDETVMGTSSWVASRAGWVDLMKLWAAQQTTMTVGGGRVVPTVFGAPVYLVKGLPSTTLALYGDFSMASVIGVKDSGLEIEAGREILMRNRQVLYVANTRFGVANHAPEFVGRLAKAAS